MRKKKVVKVVKFQFIKFIAQIFYFAGLTALIPLLPLVMSPERLVQAKTAFGFALGAIFFGFLLVYWFSHSKKVALNTLGLMTLIPGMLAVFFNFSGPRRMAVFLEYFGNYSPYLERWLESYVPKAWLLAGIYITVGVILVYWSEKVKKRSLF
jgi:hypothetical protein